MNRNLLIIGVVILLLIGGYILFTRAQDSKTPNPTNSKELIQPLSPESSDRGHSFENPKKSAHFESSTPEHGSVLAGTPLNVVINFNFDLAEPSKIIIEGPNRSADASKTLDYGMGETIIDQNKLALRRKMRLDSPDSLYTVKYTACWPDKSCHDGHFQFAIDRTMTQGYEDLTGQAQVTIKMSEISFKPKNIRVTHGTEIVWINDDEATHYVNTDSHPAHTYYPAMNSKALDKGDKYSLTLNEIGSYPYHCSAHESSMKGNILVQ